MHYVRPGTFDGWLSIGGGTAQADGSISGAVTDVVAILAKLWRRRLLRDMAVSSDMCVCYTDAREMAINSIYYYCQTYCVLLLIFWRPVILWLMMIPILIVHDLLLFYYWCTWGCGGRCWPLPCASLWCRIYCCCTLLLLFLVPLLLLYCWLCAFIIVVVIGNPFVVFINIMVCRNIIRVQVSWWCCIVIEGKERQKEETKVEERKKTLLPLFSLFWRYYYQYMYYYFVICNAV